MLNMVENGFMVFSGWLVVLLFCVEFFVNVIVVFSVMLFGIIYLVWFLRL